jgi:hypothetical protein
VLQIKDLKQSSAAGSGFVARNIRSAPQAGQDRLAAVVGVRSTTWRASMTLQGTGDRADLTKRSYNILVICQYLFISGVDTEG